MSPRRGRPTQDDVAHQTRAIDPEGKGVSRALVSLYYRGGAVSDERRQLIERAAEEVGYSHTGRQARTAETLFVFLHSETVAVEPLERNIWWQPLVDEFEATARDWGFQTRRETADDGNRDELAELVRRHAAGPVAVVLAGPWGHDDRDDRGRLRYRTVKKLEKLVPVTQISPHAPRYLEDDIVVPDSRDPARIHALEFLEAVEHAREDAGQPPQGEGGYLPGTRRRRLHGAGAGVPRRAGR